MKKLLLLATIFLNLMASELINTTYYNYKDKNQVVILFSLDEPFKGKISKIDNRSYLISGVKMNSLESKKFKDSYIKTVFISPNSKDSVKIDIYSDTKFKIAASVTKVGYGLKISIQSLGVSSKKSDKSNMSIISSNSEESSFNMLNYIIVMAILIILIIILLIIKKKGIKLPMNTDGYDYKIIFKKPLDTNNQIILIEIMGVKYLMLVGTSNILLNSFGNGVENDEILKDISKPNISGGFDEMLQNSKMEAYKLNASKLHD